jgi:hypothetical protein
MNCTAYFKTKKVQAFLKKSFKKYADKLIKEQGGLPEFAWRDYKKGFRKTVMKNCRLKKTLKR